MHRPGLVYQVITALLRFPQILGSKVGLSCNLQMSIFLSFSRYPSWITEAVHIDVRPPINEGEDVLYVDDLDSRVIKAEECERRRVFRRSDQPYFGPIQRIVLDDSSSDDEEEESSPQKKMKGGFYTSIL